MASTFEDTGARDEQSVRVLYEDLAVAEDYIRQRFDHAWGRLLHEKQVAEINKVIAASTPENVLEIAPGPARLATELKGIRRGLMIDNSMPMLSLAKGRLHAAGLAHLWQVEQGNAFELEKIERRFKFVFTFRFVRHFRRDERARLYSAIEACLESRGLLMFDVVNKTVRDRIDALQPEKDRSRLDVYDQTFVMESFRREMDEYGFKVIRLTPVINHFFLQSRLSVRLGHRLPKLSSALVRSLEILPSREPLEWIALCEKIS